MNHSAEPEAAPGSAPDNLLISASRKTPLISSMSCSQADSPDRERLDMLYELPVQFIEATASRNLFQFIVKRVIELIPGAERGALLILDREAGNLRLEASLPSDVPPISRKLIKRAVAEEQGFIWCRTDDRDITQSIEALNIETGMYAPLLWKNSVLGVICVDNPRRKSAFRTDDLEFLMAIAHFAAGAVSNEFLQRDVEFQITILERLMINFSPKLRSRLVDQAKSGRLTPGGETSNVTLLISDLCGFTKTSASLRPEEVVDMLNEYFTALVSAIFENDGTIDKFIGDAVLAIFGSPEKDGGQQKKAMKAAVEMQRAVKRVNQARASRGEPVCELGIGIHYGEALHGFIGAEERLEYTVIGDAVNRASRICDGAKGGEILVSPALVEHVKDDYSFQQTVIPTKHEGDFDVWKLTDFL